MRTLLLCLVLCDGGLACGPADAPTSSDAGELRDAGACDGAGQCLDCVTGECVTTPACAERGEACYTRCPCTCARAGQFCP